MVLSAISAVLYLVLCIVFVLARLSFGVPVSMVIAVVVTALVAVVDMKIRRKKDDLTSKPVCIREYILTGIVTATMFSVLDIVYNEDYAVHYYGEYDNTSGFFSCLEAIPDSTTYLLVLILPLLLFVCAVFAKRFLFVLSSVFALIGIITNNTVRMFGEYYIVSAGGYKSRRFNDVSEFAEVVSIAFLVLAVVCLVVSLVDIIINIKKGKKLLIISVATLLVGVICTVGAFGGYSKETTFDVDKLKENIYVETKEGSDDYLANNFYNKYGSPTTKCAYAGCNNYIASSGDTNCCTVHSNRCGNCNKYIDGDAMYCMSCIEDAFRK